MLQINQSKMYSESGLKHWDWDSAFNGLVSIHPGQKLTGHFKLKLYSMKVILDQQLYLLFSQVRIVENLSSNCLKK